MNIVVRFMLFLLLVATSGYTQSTYFFPYGRCSDKKCGSSPYELTWISKSIRDDLSQGTFCFHVRTRECTINSQYDCCNKFKKEFKKFVIHVRPECKEAFLGVSVNGQRKGGGIFYDVYDKQNAELRVTALSGINYETANRTQICVHLKAPCIPLHNFCILRDNQCYVSIWETQQHECCPRCIMPDAIQEDTTTQMFPPTEVVGFGSSPPMPILLEDPDYETDNSDAVFPGTNDNLQLQCQCSCRKKQTP
jgi:hypothetical protein